METLSARIRKEEHRVYSESIRIVIAGQYRLKGVGDSNCTALKGGDAGVHRDRSVLYQQTPAGDFPVGACASTMGCRQCHDSDGFTQYLRAAVPLQWPIFATIERMVLPQVAVGWQSYPGWTSHLRCRIELGT